MEITGINQTDFENIITTLNKSKYASNPIVIERMSDLSTTGNRISVKLGMTDSRGAGSRRSWSGRHGKYCSYFTFWDVMEGVWHKGGTRIAAGNVVYRGKDDFDVKAWDGLNQNVGSLFQPAYHEELSVDPEFDDRRFNWNTLTW